jgi:MFS family permease
MIVEALNQVLWINFASISPDAATYFGVTLADIDLLSLIFMIVFIAVTIPASWVIDTKGFRLGAGIGAILTGVFAFLRIFAGTNYTMVFIFQAGIALGQPFLMNSISKFSAQWFPEGERATATGLGTMAVFIGIFFGMLAPPLLLGLGGVSTVVLVLGIISIIGMAAFLIFAKERPATPPGPAAVEQKTFVLEGIKGLLRNRDFLILMILFLIVMGSFNAISTFIVPIIGARGDAGIVGALIIVGGIIGSVVISTLSDKYRKRKIFMVIAAAASVPLLLGITFIGVYSLLIVIAIISGFFVMSTLPIGLEFAAEQTAPIPEGTSNGLLIMMGQIGGIIFILSFLDITAGTSYILMIFLMILLAVAFGFSLILRERPLEKVS